MTQEMSMAEIFKELDIVGKTKELGIFDSLPEVDGMKIIKINGRKNEKDGANERS